MLKGKRPRRSLSAPTPERCICPLRARLRPRRSAWRRCCPSGWSPTGWRSSATGRRRRRRRWPASWRQVRCRAPGNPASQAGGHLGHAYNYSANAATSSSAADTPRRSVVVAAGVSSSTAALVVVGVAVAVAFVATGSTGGCAGSKAGGGNGVRLEGGGRSGHAGEYGQGGAGWRWWCAGSGSSGFGAAAL